MSDMIFDDVPWRVRASRLLERMARVCKGCPFEGSRCLTCDCATAAGIIRDRDAEAASERDLDVKLTAKQRRMRVLANMAGLGWLKPSDIVWPCRIKPNIKTLDLESLVDSGFAERKQPDPHNSRVFLYRKVTK